MPGASTFASGNTRSSYSRSTVARITLFSAFPALSPPQKSISTYLPKLCDNLYSALEREYGGLGKILDESLKSTLHEPRHMSLDTESKDNINETSIPRPGLTERRACTASALSLD